VSAAIAHLLSLAVTLIPTSFLTSLGLKNNRILVSQVIIQPGWRKQSLSLSSIIKPCINNNNSLGPLPATVYIIGRKTIKV
jgi:hypothetical protein